MTKQRKSVPKNPKGLLRNLPFELYLEGVGVSKHHLDDINECPVNYRFNRDHPRPRTKAMQIGSALHTLLLEPDKFEDQYIAGPAGAPRRPTEKQTSTIYRTSSAQNSIDFWQAYDRRAAGRTIISTESNEDKGIYGLSDWDRLFQMAENAMADDRVKRMLDGADTELSNYWIDPDTGLLCRNRFDIWQPRYKYLCDVKMAADISRDGFRRAIHKFRYHVQNAYYIDGAIQSKLKPEAFVFLIVENIPPFKVAIRVLKSNWVTEGRSAYRKNLKTLAECSDKKCWPGYEDIEEIETPGYAINQYNDEESDDGEQSEETDEQDRKWDL